MVRMLLAITMLLARPASADLRYPPVKPIDQAAVTADAAAAATAAATAAAASAAAAALPPTCTTMPAQDTPNGTVGVAATCIPRRDAARSTLVMPAQAVTTSNGTFSGSWPGTFISTPTTAFASAKTTTDPYTCQIDTLTTTTFAGKCWKTAQSITLPTLATALLGMVLTVTPPATAGITVMVVGRQ